VEAAPISGKLYPNDGQQLLARIVIVVSRLVKLKR
jgi:hypothetical protein